MIMNVMRMSALALHLTMTWQYIFLLYVTYLLLKSHCNYSLNKKKKKVSVIISRHQTGGKWLSFYAFFRIMAEKREDFTYKIISVSNITMTLF